MKLHARNDHTQNKQWLTSINRQSHNNNKRGCAEKSSQPLFYFLKLLFLLSLFVKNLNFIEQSEIIIKQFDVFFILP